MNIALLGGTGRTGRLILDLALERGHTVQVLARSPEKLNKRSPALMVVQGEITDNTAMSQVLTGTEVVISALGPVKGGSKTVMTDAATQLLDLMPRAGVRRLITLTGAGVPHPGDQPKLIDNVFRTLLKVMQADVLRDSVAHADLIRASTLDWTIVRAPMLQDGPITPIKSGPVGHTGPRVTRASVAAFMLDAAEASTSIRQAPAVSN
ncbi:NAD-dependent epimerase/dehydratase family protein [Deinococcus sp. Arct2-2]|uniref:NAD(P)-dependent oxidoreductase n=1 Tax=Deinococcus sp. Arct2-2 TaxID=2568653 RepID=UPI0010A2FE75|nr:NAD(P)H-binding protein [Deinococcus sp. Arct2-2]THF71712.1 NAD-dependent epimerase/dehydratase family protein [Deinococcus sp. Arct2-2]